MRNRLQRLAASVTDFLVREEGPTAVEYAVMLALVIVVCISAAATLGSNSANTYTYVGSKVKVAAS
jgi:pilus assembly protein Flp/PilA